MKHPLSRLLTLALIATSGSLHGADLEDNVRSILLAAGDNYRTEVATRGGYVYYYSLDLNKRLGEGVASPDQIWVQPPGTPSVGMALLRIHEATDEARFLLGANDAGAALEYGQLQSGAWTNAIDFDPKGSRVSQYRNGNGRGRNFSTLDDGISQAAIQLLLRLDQVQGTISDSTQIALDALLAAQFDNGSFPQGWDETPAAEPQNVPASFPSYDWRTENRIKEYWDLPTLNDGAAGTIAKTLELAHDVTGEDRYLDALKRLGDFLLLARLPEPQPGWAQQYTPGMHPSWARKFEPPAVAARESEDVIKTLLFIAGITRDSRYLLPVERSLQWLRNSLLPDGQLARYYELETNRPLYMERRGDVYSLTYDDSNLPSHYGFKIEPRIREIAAAYQHLRNSGTLPSDPVPDEAIVLAIVDSFDLETKRWISTAVAGERLVGQPKFQEGEEYLSSTVFVENVTTLCDWLAAQ